MSFRTVPYKIVDDGNMSANFTSSVIKMRHQVAASISFIWSSPSAPTGTIVLQVSNSMKDEAHISDIESDSWIDIDESSVDVADTYDSVAGTAGRHCWNLYSFAGRYLRVKYTATSGLGTANVTVLTKELI